MKREFLQEFRVGEQALPKEVIDAIHEAGGVAFVAHPGRSGVLAVLDELVEMGLDGIEVWTPENTEEQTQAFFDYAKKNNLLMTGGSDFHGLYSRKANTIASSSSKRRS